MQSINVRYTSCCSLQQDYLTRSIVAVLLQDTAHIANSVSHGW